MNRHDTAEVVITSSIPVAQEVDPDEDIFARFSPEHKRKIKLILIGAVAAVVLCLVLLWSLMWLSANFSFDNSDAAGVLDVVPAAAVGVL